MKNAVKPAPTTQALEAEQARLDRKISVGRATATDRRKNMEIRGELSRRFDLAQAEIPGQPA